MLAPMAAQLIEPFRLPPTPAAPMLMANEPERACSSADHLAGAEHGRHPAGRSRAKGCREQPIHRPSAYHGGGCCQGAVKCGRYPPSTRPSSQAIATRRGRSRGQSIAPAHQRHRLALFSACALISQAKVGAARRARTSRVAARLSDWCILQFRHGRMAGGYAPDEHVPARMLLVLWDKAGRPAAIG